MAGKVTAGKKPPAKKKQAKSAGKSSAGRKPADAPVPPSTRGRGGNNAPLYLLLALALLAALVIVINNRYSGETRRDGARHHDSMKDKRQREASDRQAREAGAKEGKDGGDANIAGGPGDVKSPVEREVSIYLVRFDERTEKTSMVAVRRKVKAVTPLEGALAALIAGPNAAEKRRGYLTAVPGSLRLLDAKILNDTAVVDFSSDIEWGATGNILLSRIDQIIYTATQFDGVGSVIIKINGRRKNFIGSDGLAISGPLHRK